MIKYQKNNINKKQRLKNIINLIFIHFSIRLEFFLAFSSLLSYFISNIFSSDKDNFFKIKLIKAETIVEYNIWGI